MKKLLAFFIDTRGAIAIMGGLLLAPVITMMAIGIQLTDSTTRQTRLLQAMTSAAYAISKEGEASSSTDRNRLMNGYMSANLDAVREREDSLTMKRVAVDLQTERLSASYTPKSVFESLVNVSLPHTFKESQVTAVRKFKPMELVIIIDGSSSVSQILPQLREGAAKVVDEVFRVTKENTYISLVAYSGYVNIGWEYKDKLITPESRRIYYKEQRMALLPLGLDNDLLSPNGPEGVRQGACVLRPKYLPEQANGAVLKKYVDDIEVPPESPDQGFTLLMGDGRPVPLEGPDSTATGQTHLFFRPGLVKSTTSIDSATHVDKDRPFYVGDGRVTNVASVPPELKEGQKPVQITWADEEKQPRKFYRWGPAHSAAKSLGRNEGGENWSDLHKNGVQLFVHVPWDCTTMPMLVASQDKQEILERIDMLKDMWTTGTDEGIAWAMRILSPNWRNIWEKGNYPAEYHDGVTTKRILLIGGSMTAGYYTEGRDAVSEMCKKIKENGVELYILVDQADNPNPQSQRIYRKCAEENYVLAPSSQAFPELMEKIASRTSVVSLSK